MNENLNKIIKRNVKRWFAIQQQNKKQLKLATVIKLLLFKLSKFLLAYVSKLELCGVKCLHLSASEACGFLFGFFSIYIFFPFLDECGRRSQRGKPQHSGDEQQRDMAYLSAAHCRLTHRPAQHPFLHCPAGLDTN